MRHIVLDTETTGLDPKSGHRVIEIGCVELVNHVPSGNVFHHYINPERDVSTEAERIHGISTDMLKDKPVFADIAGPFIDFIADDPLVIHNAGFDMGFLNAELVTLGYVQLQMNRAIDTVQMARRRFPGAPANLDALCKRFNIDSTARHYHGALLDARLLADVYLELVGGKQPDLAMGLPSKKENAVKAGRVARAARLFVLNEDEAAAHTAAMQNIKDNLWG